MAIWGTARMSKYKASPQLGNDQLGVKRAKGSAAPSSPIMSKKAKSPITSIGPSFSPPQKIPSSPQKIKRPSIDSFWQTDDSDEIADYLQLSEDTKAYAIRVHYFYSWLGMFVQGLLVDEIATAFAAITFEWYEEAKPRIKENMQCNFEAEYYRLYNKLAGHFVKYSKEWIASAAGSTYKKAYIETRFVITLYLLCAIVAKLTTQVQSPLTRGIRQYPRSFVRHQRLF